MKSLRLLLIANCSLLIASARAEDNFDQNRWHETLHRVQDAAINAKISARTINQTIQDSQFLPEIIRRDKNQPEFTITLRQYLDNSINNLRIQRGKKAGREYPTILGRVEKKYNVPRNIILALWGMESDFGRMKSQYKISDSFLTLIYDGRRAGFFEGQLIALMKLADKNALPIETIQGSWAGAMGHFQFIPTTLAQYGVDGNNDGKIDISNSVGDAIYSAANYLSRLGWDPKERIARQVKLPADFNMMFCDGNTKKSLGSWRAMGIIGVPAATKTAGLICDASVYPAAWLAYDNFYRIKRWNNSNYYATAAAILSDKLK
ncbi:MAG: lytic murein transglycosylase [Rickettsiales bacterium]|jgi:lytic murein transglycosylase|nr:lytic murein transglycosylase [Rickettsiales bacterium]